MIRTLLNLKRITRPSPPGPTKTEIMEALEKKEAFFTLDAPIHFTQKYGEFFRIPTLKRFYCVTGAKGFEHILKTKGSQYNKNNIYYSRMKAIFGNSILVTEGSHWKHRRKISQPAFQLGMIKNYSSMFVEECQSFVQEFTSAPTKLEKPVNVLTLMNHLTLSIALKLFCGQTFSKPIINRISKATYFGNWYVSHALFIKPWKPTFNNIRFYYLTHRLNKTLLAIIRERRAKRATVTANNSSETEHQIHSDATSHNDSQTSESFDLLDLLLAANNEDNTRPLTDHEVLDEFKTLLLTGHETTAAGLTWMWYLLALHPHYRKLVEEELATVLGGRPPQMEDLPQLPLLKAVILETFRLYPPIWSLARSSLKEDVIQDFAVPQKSLIILHIYALHRNPKYWDRPNEFNPYRFMGEAFKQIPTFAYLPFGFGPRICIANNLGVIESMFVAATLLQQLHFKTISKTKAIPEPCISLRPKKGIWMKSVLKLNQAFKP
jgi:cytochrome P450